MSVLPWKALPLLFAVLCLSIIPLAVQAVETVPYQGRGRIDLTLSYQVLHDPSGQADLAQVMRSDRFADPDGKAPNFGFGPGNIWGRVRIDLSGAPQPQRWRFVWNLTFIDTSDVYVVGDDGTVLAHKHMGKRIARPNDEAVYYWFDLTAYTARPLTLYVRNDSRYSLRLDSLLMTDEANGFMEAEASLFNGLLVGALGVSAAMFLGIGIVFLSPVHLYGAIVGAMLMWINMAVSGLNNRLGLSLSSGDDWMLAQVPIMGVNVALPLFIAAFCDTPAKRPRLYRWFLALCGLMILVQGAVVVWWPYQTLAVGTAGFLLACVLILALSLGDRKVLRSDRLAVLGSMSPFMVLSILHLVSFNNLAPEILPFQGLNQHFLDMAFVSLMVGFIVAVAYRTKRRLEKIIQRRTAQLAEAKSVVEISLQNEQQSRQRLHTFIQMATHEFKTPLSVISGATQVLELLVEPDNKEINSRLDIIRQSVCRVVDLVNVCLKGERYDTLSPHFSQLRPQQFFEQVVARNSAYPGTAIELVTSDLPASWTADSNLLGIALDALIDNARRYAGKTASIWLQVRCNGETLEISVCDDGPGVAAAEAHLIFEKYYRGMHRSAQPGTGIGLHLVKAVAEMHNGSAAYAPCPSGGAMFTLTVPMAEAVTP